MNHLANVFDRVRLRQPVVHAITNTVTASDVAHVIRAIGARPIMAVAVEEVEEIVSRADALVLNLGADAPEELSGLDRLIEVVSADPDEAAGGRSRWRAYKARGLGITHHSAPSANG
jgi:hydroxyethylthiazole kinase-like sugar kinase family protein